MSEQNDSPVVNVSASDSATLTDASTLSYAPADERAMQAEPLEIARRYRWERIERAARAFLESEKTYEAMSRALADLRIAYYSPPSPPPDEPRLTRAELIALTEDAEQYLQLSAYKDDYEIEKRTRDESRAAIAKARDLIGRGEDRLKPERFTPKD